jgi:hypothetical protein
MIHLIQFKVRAVKLSMRQSQYYWAAILILILTAASCTKSDTLTATPPSNDGNPSEINKTASPTPSPLRATPSLPAEDDNTLTVTPSTPNEPDVPLPSYTLTAVLNYAGHSLTVEENINYVNRSQDVLNELRLMVDPMYYPDVFHLQGLAWENGMPVEGITTETGQMTLPLRQPLTPGESVGLSLTYELRLPSPVPSEETRPVPFGYTNRQTNLVDWYPFVAPYVEGKGWIANPAYFFGEHLAYELSDFEVSIHIIDDSPNLTIAASAAAENDGEWRRYYHPAARNFSWSVSHEYQVTSTTLDGVTIHSYAFPLDAKASDAVLSTTAEALELYSELYGSYPRDTLSVVEADFLDGMEYDGMYFLSDGFYNLYQGSPGEYLITIAAHETAHQWFYASVGNDQALEPWLDEALCTFNELIYYENLHPEVLDWWWTYRVDYYEPRGWVDSTIYNPDGYRAYRDAVYLNGAKFLDELRNLIGKDHFQQFLGDYVKQNQGDLATADIFFSTLEKHTDLDYESLLDSFFSYR